MPVRTSPVSSVAPDPCHLLTAVCFFPPVTFPSAVLEKPAETKYPTDVRSSLFVQTFVACVASAVDPVLLVRLLAHRLVTTPLYPRNSSSITSMSGQDQFPPRTTRSRASSTDTNASTRRKRVSSTTTTVRLRRSCCDGYERGQHDARRGVRHVSCPIKRKRDARSEGPQPGGDRNRYFPRSL